MEKKGIVFLPKAVRELAGIKDECLVVIEADREKIVVKPLRVVRVKATEKVKQVVEDALREEYVLEEEKAGKLVERK